MRLYAIIENGEGKEVKIGSNETITATLYEGNKKIYGVTIDWTNVGDIEEPTMGAIVTAMEWRNQPVKARKMSQGKKQKGENVNQCKKCGANIEIGQVSQTLCRQCLLKLGYK